MSLDLIDSMITSIDCTVASTSSEVEKTATSSTGSTTVLSTDSILRSLNDLFVVNPTWIEISPISKAKDMKFPELSNTSFLDTAFGRGSIDRIPIWIHRQAGRYLPEFKETRARVGDFFTCCQTPSVCCELTMQPIKRFDYDASIIFSDILVIPQVLGFNVDMVPGKGPTFDAPLCHAFSDPSITDGSVTLLKDGNMDELKKNIRDRLTFEWAATSESIFAHVTKELEYVYKAINETRTALDGKVPLIGFVGAPLTLLGYLCDGQGSKHSHTYSKTKAFLYRFPEEAHFALKIISDCIIAHLIGQVVFGGAQAIEMFESNCGEFTADIFDDYCMPYLKYIKDSVDRTLVGLSLKKQIPFLLFPRNIHNDALKSVMDNLNFDVIAIDWSKSAKNSARLANLTGQCALMGNLDPWMLIRGASDQEIIKSKVFKMLDGFAANGSRKGKHIVNLGHGLMPNCDPEAVGWFIQAVREYSEANQS